MAKFKVHMAGAGTSDEGGLVALCKTKARTLLPLRLAAKWDAVTCERCLKHRPAPASRWSRFIQWFDTKFMARRG